MSPLSVLRYRLECGQSVYLDDLAVRGTIVAIWPVEGGSEARVRLDDPQEGEATPQIVHYRFGTDEARR